MFNALLAVMNIVYFLSVILKGPAYKMGSNVYVIGLNLSTTA